MTRTSLPYLSTSIPGPLAKKLVEENDRFVSPSLPHAYPLAVKRARGCMVEDLDGNRFLDCAAGIAVNSTGHCHPRVVKAIREQSEKLLHICGADFYEPQYIKLAQRLGKLAPGGSPKKVYLGNSGTEAVEAAIKLSRYHTGRPNIVSFFGAFHGRTMGSVSLTASQKKYHKGFSPLLPGVANTPYAYCYRCDFNLTYPDCDFACVDYIESNLFAKTVPAEEVAAIFVEPVQGEGGYIVPPTGWLNRLRELCDVYGILLVADEVQSGVGRTGKLFAAEHSEVEPDILCSAKALASGMPLSAMIAKSDVMSWSPGAHGSTQGGNPLGCAAAQATLDIIEDEGLLENAKEVGKHLLTKLQNLSETSKLIGDIRGQGLMIGVELVEDKVSKERAIEKTDQVMLECFKHGLLVLPCGPNSIRFSPPLIISKEEVNTAFNIFTEALTQVESTI